MEDHCITGVSILLAKLLVDTGGVTRNQSVTSLKDGQLTSGALEQLSLGSPAIAKHSVRLCKPYS